MKPKMLKNNTHGRVFPNDSTICGVMAFPPGTGADYGCSRPAIKDKKTTHDPTYLAAGVLLMGDSGAKPA
jgi:hypothetical protein